MFIATAGTFLALAATQFALMRVQLIVPENDLIKPEIFNRLMTGGDDQLLIFGLFPLISG